MTQDFKKFYKELRIGFDVISGDGLPEIFRYIMTSEPRFGSVEAKFCPDWDFSVPKLNNKIIISSFLMDW